LYHKVRLVLIATALIFGVSTSSIVVRADGNLLRGFDVPATVPFSQGNGGVGSAIYWPIGVSFDGKNLWYSQPCDCTSDIFHATTDGVLLNTLHEVNQAGALAWDGTHLWVASATRADQTCTAGSTGCAFITEVDVTTGNPIKVIDISAVFAPDQMCGFIDGLSWDTATGTLWVSPDIGCAIAFTSDPCHIGFIYNIDTSGTLLKRLQLPYSVAGVAKVGNNLYDVTCATSPRSIYKTDLDGNVISSFSSISVSGNHESPESVAFDPVTFAPNCALWTVQDYGIPFDASLAAYQIACP
jgi:hypothetical protein